MKSIDPKDLIIHVNQCPPPSKAGDVVAIDTEFFHMQKSRLHRPHGDFAGIGCTYDGKEVWILTSNGIEDESTFPSFMWALDEALHVFHNSKFDIGQIRRYCSYPDRKLLWDTLTVEQILYAGWFSAGEFSLADLSRRHLDLYMDKSVREQFENEESDTMSREQIEYLAVDVVTTWLVQQAQAKKADKNDLNVWYNIDRCAIYSLLKTNGMMLDVDKWRALAEFNRNEAEKIAQKYEGINLGSWQQVKKELLNQGYEVDSTNEKALNVIANECEFTRDVLEYRGRTKAAGTYGEKWVDEFVEPDGRIYSNFYVNGAACLPAGELVLTSLGYVPTEKVKIGTYVISHNGIPQKVIDVFPNQVSTILRVDTYGGMRLRCSENHPFLVERHGAVGWVEARDLESSDKVFIQKSLYGMEQWKVIPEWEDFSVSTWGRVLNNKTNNILTQYPKGKWGYLKVQLYRNGSQKRGADRKDFPVHRLVALVFYGKSDLEVCHKNGISWDNSVLNLYYGTTQENRRDGIRHGSILQRNIKQIAVTPEMVEYIRSTPYKRGNDTRMSKELGISREYVEDIRKYERMKDYDIEDKKVEFYKEKIHSVVWDGKEMVYGITVENDHSHVTGGIITHNTGRLSSSEPNVENIPVRDGNQFRECFIAQPGYVLVDADFSAQEPRVWSYISGDCDMQQIFRDKRDIYIYFAKEGFGWDIDKKDPRRSKRMKPTVLGAIFGLTKYGLLQKDQIPLEEGEELLNAFWKVFKRSKVYKDEIQKTRDYVQTVYGRKYWLNPYQFGYQNNTLNSPVQGTAADITKISGYKFQREVEKAGYSEFVFIINYIHDEILVECREDLKEWTMETLKKVMMKVAEKTHDGVPADVEVKSGYSWADAH